LHDGYGENNKAWERIAFRVAGAFLLPLALSAYALFAVSERHADLAQKKDELARLWSGAHAAESRALLQVSKLRLHAAAVVADPQPSLFPQIKSGLQAMRFELEQLDKLRARLSETSGVGQEAAVREISARLRQSQAALAGPAEKLLEHARRQSAPDAQAARRELERLCLDTEAGLANLVARHELYEQQTFAGLGAQGNGVANQVLFYIILVALSAAAAAAFLAYTIARPLREVAGRVRELAANEGGLAKRVPLLGAGEIAEVVASLNRLLEKRESVIAAVANASEVVGSTTERVSDHTNRLIVIASGINKNMMEQSMNLDEATSSLGSIDDLIHSSGESTRQAASLSKIAMDRAHQGGASVHETIAAMEKIEESSRKVEELVSSITDIASQTNLLAINAAIEATKAGEHGKGFAVVAEEVRKLAERSRKLTGEVTSHIGESSNRVKAGVTLAKGAGISLDGIIKDVEAVASLIQRIAASASKQSESSSLILEFMQKVSANVRTTLDELREVNRSTELTSQEVARLDALVNQLNATLGPQESNPAREYAEAIAAQEAMARRRAEEEQRSVAVGVSVPMGLAPLPAGSDAGSYAEDDQDPSALLNSLRSDEITLSMDLNAPPASPAPAVPAAPALPPSAPKLPGIPERPSGGGKKDAA
jgi:methyl-accepting chemotaxis protein